MYSPPRPDTVQINWISCWVGTYFNTQLVDLYCLNTSTFVRKKQKKEDCLKRACLDNLVINNNHALLYKDAHYLLFSLVDAQEKDELRQKHGRCCVWMDAPGVGLEASQAGQHQDSEDESQHRQAQSGVGDQGQGLQISLQLLLTEKWSWGQFWILEISLSSSDRPLTSLWELSINTPKVPSLWHWQRTWEVFLYTTIQSLTVQHPPKSCLQAKRRKNDKTVNDKPILFVWVSSWNKQCGCWMD